VEITEISLGEARGVAHLRWDLDSSGFSKWHFWRL